MRGFASALDWKFEGSECGGIRFEYEYYIYIYI